MQTTQDVSVSRRLEIDDEVFRKVEANCPKYLSTTGFINLILDQNLQDSGEVRRLAAYSVGAENHGSINKKLPLQFPPDLEVTSSTAPTETVLPSKGKSLEPLSLIPNLEKFNDLIREFFRLKKGSKSKTAWAHLMTGLTKIQDKYGDDVVQEQLMAAINGRWAGVTLKNYEEFGKPKPKPAWQQEPDTKHPAHRDFTAERLEAERQQRSEEEKHNFLNF